MRFSSFFSLAATVGLTIAHPIAEPENGVVNLAVHGKRDAKNVVNNFVLSGNAEPRDEPAGFVSVPVHQKRGSLSNRRRDLIKRGGHDKNVSLTNAVSMYTADLGVGTPPQYIQVVLDTGSSDLWVYTDGVKLPDVNETYSPNKSSTYEYVSDDFQIQYVTGSNKGHFANDNMELGDLKLKAQRFAYVDQVTKDSPPVNGILGIGFSSGETTTDNDSDKYSNLPQSLANQKLIKKNAYSLFLDDLDGSSGSILFGGVDTSKYSGDLYTVPMTDSKSLEVSCSVNGSEPVKATLDSGTSLTYLPGDLVAKLAVKLGAIYDLSYEMYFFPKKLEDDTVVEFDFSGAKINVPGSELAVDASEYDASDSIYPYVFTIAPSEGSQNIVLLGDSFLRSAYVVYDLDDKKVALAQASYDNESNDVKVIENEIPGAKPAPNVNSK